MLPLENILRDHMDTHPAAELRDAAKLLYQSEFGGGHLISDPAGAFEYLRRELASCADNGVPLSEDIGGGSVRLNLLPASRLLSAETIFRSFYLSSQSVKGASAGFCEKLRLLYELGFEESEVDDFLRGYSAAGYPMLSHSDAYRAAYAPAYRVVDERYIRYIDILSAVDRLRASPGPAVIAVDGMCASGKTTLASMLSEIFDAAVYHADDYFLPPSMRTPERLSEPGGNMDRERLAREVLIPLSQGRAPVTHRFDCHTLSLEPPVTHELRHISIVEGSYCLHPDLTPFYTLKISLRTSPDTQLDRLKARDPSSLPSFLSRWIPLETAYIASTSLYSRSDLVHDT